MLLQGEEKCIQKAEDIIMEIKRILKGIEGIKFMYFSEKDVVRHKLVQKIIRVHEKHEKDNAATDKH